jgi:hypothetical protein
MTRPTVGKKTLYRKEPRYVTQIAVWVPDATALIEGCRYDSCYPASEAESHKIGRLANYAAEPGDHVVLLTRVARTDAPPTLARRRSFGAAVLRQWHPEDSPPTQAELEAAALARDNAVGS